MATALQIITRALQKNGVLVGSEAPSADMATDGLVALNDMLDSWSNDSLMIYARTDENFPLSAGVSTYTIGPAQTFNTARPISLIDASYTRLFPNFDEPVTVITDELYNAITDKTSLGRPLHINYSNGNPTAEIKLWPVPDQNYTLYLTSEKPLTNWTLYQDVILPPGWNRALTYNLAIDLAPDYGQPVTEAMATIAAESRANIARAVLKARPLDAFARGRGNENIYTGWLT
jgi:hypothetical protein